MRNKSRRLISRTDDMRRFGRDQHQRAGARISNSNKFFLFDTSNFDITYIILIDYFLKGLTNICKFREKQSLS